ncbi:hypothetical protein J2S06_001589 [Bacillus alveayuensis]|uniref:AraC family transcriptional regulator n=1 Tax=Aeribacillus alveayuensis TaxID=279215 RepID=A0ABT9VNV0_9BACI|nr:hypothetical protein [Bacillus alveayuensis]
MHDKSIPYEPRSLRTHQKGFESIIYFIMGKGEQLHDT